MLFANTKIVGGAGHYGTVISSSKTFDIAGAPLEASDGERKLVNMSWVSSSPPSRAVWSSRLLLIRNGTLLSGVILNGNGGGAHLFR